MICEKCNLFTQCIHPCVMGEGDPNAKLFLIGEAPGFEEDRQRRPFVGPAGQLLNHILNKLGVARGEVYISNVIKCRPRNNDLPTGEERDKIVDACWPHLRRELQDVDPKVVVLLGSVPLQELTGEKFITKWEGMEVESVYEGARTFACFHPAFVLRSPGKEANVARALERACRAAGIKRKHKGLEAGLYEYEIRT